MVEEPPESGREKRGRPDAGSGQDAGDEPGDRRWAALAVLPFLLLGLADVALLLVWGIDPLWGFAILPPILFLSALAWIAFRSGFVSRRA